MDPDTATEDAVVETVEAEPTPDVEKINEILKGARAEDTPVETPADETPSDVPAEEAPETSAPKTTEVEFDADILAAAAYVGMPEAAARSFPSVHALEDHLRPLFPRQAQTQGQAEAVPDSGKFVIEGLDLKADDFDPAVVKMSETLKAMNDFYAQQVAELREGQQSTTERVTNWEQQLVAEQERQGKVWLGEQIGNLPEEVRTFVGDEQKSAIEQHILTRHYGAVTAQLPIPAPEALFKEAVSAVLAPNLAEIERQKISKSLHKQQDTMLTRPTNRNGKRVSEDETMRRNVRAILAEAREEEGLAG